jgi:hypothetical protein
MRVNKWAAGIGIAAALLLNSPANATVYFIDFSGAVSVSGTLTTDGSLGSLGATNFTAFNFTVSGGGESTHFNSAAGYIIAVGAGITANASGLFFNFSGSNSNTFDFISPGFALPAFCIQDSTEGCFPAPAGFLYITPSNFTDSPRTGLNTQIASSIIPEPATWILMLLGFVGLGLSGYRGVWRGRAAQTGLI